MAFIDIIIAGVLSAAPAIAAVFGIIAGVIKIKNNNKESLVALNNSFQEVKEEVIKNKEYETLKDELKLAHQENRELKKFIKELLTTMDKVERPKED